MLTKVEVFSSQPAAPEISFGGFFSNLDPIQLRDMDGLGPVKAAITTSKLASSDGEILNGTPTIGSRNIVLKLGFNPNWVDQTISSLRRQLYNYFMPKEWCKLRLFSDDMPTVDIEGYVETCDPNIFSQDPEMVVSIICPKPDFIEPDATIYTGVVDDGTAELEFEYTGTVPTGIEVRIQHSVANVAYTGPLDISLQRETEEVQLFTVDPVTISSAYFFKFSSIRTAKRVQQIPAPSGDPINLLMHKSAESVWPQLKKGTNLFKVAALETGQEWTLAFFNRYGGL